MGIQTEFEFTLPKGYVDENGALHRNGLMRLATAADEILPLKDPKVQRNPTHKSTLVLSRVIVRLGKLREVNPRVIECLFAADLAYLQSFYNKINGVGTTQSRVVCPSCNTKFEVEKDTEGE